MSLNTLFRQKKTFYSWGVIFLLSLGIIGEISLFELLIPSINSEENSNRSFSLPRLASDQSTAKKLFENLVKQEFQNTTSLTRNDKSLLGNFSEPSVIGKNIPLISFGINENPDLNITGITPGAMEKSATYMTFTLNLNIPDATGLGVNAVENLTLTNGTFYPITGWTGWIQLQDENGTFIDKYTLDFSLNNTFLTSLDFGSYDLIMYTNVSGYFSSDSISLPMQDVWVDIQGVIEPEFNNKLDTEQFFSVEIKVQFETFLGNFSVDFLPVNPTAYVKSVASSGSLQFLGFISNNTDGEYTLNYSLSAIIAQDFEDGDHELVVSVTTSQWITDNATTVFTAKGTTYHVILDEITVESNSPINYDELMATSEEDVTLRLNVDDFVNISFHIYDSENDVNSTRVHDIGYQDPEIPEDPSELLYEGTLDSGIGSIILTASDITPETGYTLLFFVRGHRTSQEIENPSNITIYWDLLSFDYTYFDNIPEEGSSFAPNQKALGLDVNETWTLKLRLIYASDGTSAISETVSFRFGGGSWSNITDGLSGDTLDGFFNMNHSHTFASVVLFECNITSGSSFDPLKMIFVDQTLGANNFNLSVTWTYLIIDMIPAEQDHRLSILTATTTNQTYIVLNTTWAHNSSLLFDDIIIIFDHFRSYPYEVEIIAGEGIYYVLPNINTGIYRYSIVAVDDGKFGITKFANSTFTQLENPQVQVDLIWEAIEFEYSDTMYSNLTNWDNMGVLHFFTDYGLNGTLFVYARHSYDNSSFNGTALLFAFEIAGIYILTFENGVAIWSGNLTTSFEISFAIMQIEEDLDYGIRGVGSFNSVTVSWDKIVLTLESKHSYSHGSWAEIFVNLNYLVAQDILVNPASVFYDLLLSNGTLFGNISWVMFKDFSFSTGDHSYFVTNVFDSSTGLSKAEIRFKWTDQVEMKPELGDLTIFWVDDKKPTIVQLYTVDLGNGSILIIIDAVDDSEDWLGSGIDSVKLFVRRGSVYVEFPEDAKSVLLSSGIHRYFFKYSYNETFEDVGGSFRFSFMEVIEYIIRITDNELNFVETGSSFLADNDKYDPSFLPQNGIYILVFYPKLIDQLSARPSISDGDVSISVFVQDIIWSGIDTNSIELIITDLDNNVSSTHFMSIFEDSEPPGDLLQFQFNITLRVGGTYQFVVNIADIAGNRNSQTTEITIEDHVAPRVNTVDIELTDNRELIIHVTLNESGYGVDYVRVGFIDTNGDIIQWVNLSKSIGGGSGIHSSLEEYYALTSLPFDLSDLFSSKEYSISLMIADYSGNQKNYTHFELILFELTIDDTLPPLMFHPLFIIVGVIILISVIVVGIRITSKTEGYDMKRIFDNAEKISREVILTQMDEYALGVTINFFDQVQGPVPVIWEPALLEDQEQVMLDLADKSFSTLEFIGLEETERSGTFDFSTGSYDCTALGYSFGIDNPQARGGKENLTVVLLLRKEWGDNLLVFQDELIEKLREIRVMIETQQEPTQVEKSARELREFVSRLMLSFNKLYENIDYESGMQEEIE